MNGSSPESKSPPWSILRTRLEELAGACSARGEAETAGLLLGLLAEWHPEQRAWEEQALETLSAHHDINNALVGVRGNAQLLMMNPVAQAPAVRERLEVMLRESSRIQEAAGRLRSLRTSLGGSAHHPHAA